jgi:thiol-disulfide isomerase/thioredoxin
LLVAVVATLSTPVDATGPDAPHDTGAAEEGATRHSTTDTVEVVVFFGEGCPYCAQELEFLVELQDRTPQVEILAYEVWENEANRAYFRSMADTAGIDAGSVPTTFIGDLVWVGFDSVVADQITAAVDALLESRTPEVVERTEVGVPIVGTVDVADTSLIVATLLIGFVDGINPCSFWVLSVLLALVLHSGSRTRIAVVGVVFLSVTSALYGLYMFGAYSALDYAAEMTWVRVAVALVAGAFGVLHLKEYVTHRGPSLTIADDRKPGMYRRMRSLARTDRSLPAVLAGTVVLAVGVSLAETPCTAGLPLLWTNLLTARDVSSPEAAFLFGLYLLAFLIDELIVFTIAVVGLRATKVQEHHARLLQLISGTLMLALALTMLFAPHALETVAGMSAVFGATVTVILLVSVIDRHLRPTGHGPARATRS